MRLGDGSQFVERVVAPAMVDLPIQKGQKLGEVVVTLGGVRPGVHLLARDDTAHRCFVAARVA